MAIDAATIWEVRTTGSQNNGGGFADLDPGTSVDYSQQATSQLSPSDLAMTTGGTTLTSATGGFTAAMVGNVIHITSGTNFTAGWYQITGYTNTNTVTIDQDATSGGNGSSGQGYVGGAFLIGGSLDDDFANQWLAGNTIYIKAGTYTLGELMYPLVSGTKTEQVKIYGYNLTRGDEPTGTDRPFLQCGIHSLRLRDYSIVAHIRADGTGATYGQISPGNYNTVLNCKAENTSVSAGRPAFKGTANTLFIGCEGISANGEAFDTAGRVFMCYAHDSNAGFWIPDSVIGCVVANCTTYGIYEPGLSESIVQCTIYNCGTGIMIDGTFNYGAMTVCNTIFQGCTTALDAQGETDQCLLTHCTLYDNTTDLATNIDECLQVNNRAVDPGLVDPANGDFSITSLSDVYEQGLDIQVYTGAIVR